MIKTIFEKYDWTIEVYVINWYTDIEHILRRLKQMKCPDTIINKAITRITEYVNSGITYSDNHTSIMIINKPENMEEFVDIYNHEKNHIEMQICKEFDIDPFSEEAAYLSGQLAKKLFASQLETWLR